MCDCKKYPQQNWLLCSRSGGGKTTAVATWPKCPQHQMLVFMFDPYGKDQPLLDQGKPTGVTLGLDGTPWQYVLNDAGEPIITIGYFFDLNPARRDFANHETAYERFQATTLNEDLNSFGTIVVDSLGGFTSAVMRGDKYKFNKITKKGNEQHGAQHYAAAMSAIYDDVMGTLCWTTTNFVCCVHTNTAPQTRMDNKPHPKAGGREQVEGEKLLYGFDAPGQLSMNLSRAFSEIYHVHRDYQRRVSYFQTVENENYPAQTHIGAPDMCVAEYERLWGGYA